jgi:hypothetical protein
MHHHAGSSFPPVAPFANIVNIVAHTEKRFSFNSGAGVVHS